MSYKKKILWLLSGLVLLMSLLTAAPYVAEHQLISSLHSFTQRTVLLDDIDFNPFTLELRLEKFKILEKNSDHAFISFDAFYLNASWKSLFQMAIIIDELYLKQPYAHGVMFSEKIFNYSDLIPSPVKSPPIMTAPVSKNEPVKFDQLPVSFYVKHFDIIDGALDFIDKPNDIQHQLKQVSFCMNNLTNLSNATDTTASIMMSLQLNELIMNMHMRADFFQEIPKAKMIIRCEKGDLAYYQPYISNIIDWELAKAILKTNIGLTLEIKDGIPDVMVHGHLAINNFRLIDNAKKPLINFPLMEIDFNSKPLQSNIHVSSVKLIQPDIRVTRRNNKSLSVIPVLKNQPDVQNKHDKKIPQKKPLPDVQIEKVIIEKGHIWVNDNSLKKPFQTEIQNMQLTLEKINLTNMVMPSIQFKTDILPHGNIDMNGSLDLKPMKWIGKMNINDLDISMIQPYLEPFINGHLESGRLFMQMNALVHQKNHSPHAEISGSVALNHLVFREPVKKNEFLVWEQFQINHFNCGLFPHYIDIDEIRIRKLKAPVVLQANGNLNWLSLLKNQTADNCTSETQKISQTTRKNDAETIRPSLPFERLIVNKIILEDSSIRFVDLTMTPVFQAQMSQLNGQVLGFDQDESKSMDFVLNGALNDLSRLKIVGRLTPFQKPLSLKVDVRFDGIEVPVFTPYTSHYIGYPVDKGQLTLNLDYIIEGNQLISTNKVMINQLELGEKNENAKIPSLPLKFALALLKDREGKINIEIPVNGNLDSLNFSLKNVIFKTLQNLLERMVTSPFSFLSSWYGYSEDLKYLVFDYGKSDLNLLDLKKIEHISKMMIDRPLLKLHIFSHLNATEDQKALKRIQLRREIELLKFKDQASLSETTRNLEQSRLTEKEYDFYLIQLYKSYFKVMPASEFQDRVSLEPTVLSIINIAFEDLHALALKRMVMVRNTLVDEYKIAPDRIFIQEKKPASKALQNINKSQVLLELQY